MRRTAELEAGQRAAVKVDVVTVISTCFLLGGSWLSGYVMLIACWSDMAKQVAGVVFLVLNGVQGLFVFWIYVSRLNGGWRLITRDFTRLAKKSLHQMKTEQFKL